RQAQYNPGGYSARPQRDGSPLYLFSLAFQTSAASYLATKEKGQGESASAALSFASGEQGGDNIQAEQGEQRTVAAAVPPDALEGQSGPHRLTGRVQVQRGQRQRRKPQARRDDAGRGQVIQVPVHNKEGRQGHTEHRRF